MNEQETRRVAYQIAESILAADVPPHPLSIHTASGLTEGQAIEALTSSSFGFVSRRLAAQRVADGSAVTSTTLASDSVLTLTLAASSKYIFEVIGFAINAGHQEGLKIALNGTVGVTAIKAQVKIFADNLFAFTRVAALNSDVGAWVGTGDSSFEIRGSIETSTAGTLLVQIAQNATGASAGVILQRCSNMTAVKVG